MNIPPQSRKKKGADFPFDEPPEAIHVQKMAKAVKGIPIHACLQRLRAYPRAQGRADQRILELLVSRLTASDNVSGGDSIGFKAYRFAIRFTTCAAAAKPNAPVTKVAVP